MSANEDADQMLDRQLLSRVEPLADATVVYWLVTTLYRYSVLASVILSPAGR
jgi:hypothetical protein